MRPELSGWLGELDNMTVLGDLVSLVYMINLGGMGDLVDLGCLGIW